MSFGSSKPIAVRVIGTDYDEVREHAEKIAAEMKQIPYLRDVGFEQTLDYPTVEIDIDRELAGLIGITPEHLKRALVMATSSTRFSNLNYWINAKTGFDYLVQIQVPPLRMEKPEDIEELPLQSVNPDVPLMVRDVLKDGRVHESVRPGEYDRDMSQRYLTMVANVEGEDMGRAANQVRQAVKDAGEPPRGVRIEEMGPLPSMTQMFEALGIGLAVAVFVILVLLTAYFQSPRLAIISIGAVPGVLAGIVTMLYFSNTTLNIESFMGSIMCIGVSVSNSVMMVTFMDEHWRAGKPSDRGRPPGRQRTPAADPDDGLRHVHRHGADGAGPGARQPDGGPAGPGGDRRAGDVHVRHPAGAPLDLRAGDRPEGGPLAVALPGQPRERLPRPGSRRRRHGEATAGIGTATTGTAPRRRGGEEEDEALASRT